jgi:hypothetical protein
MRTIIILSLSLLLSFQVFCAAASTSAETHKSHFFILKGEMTYLVYGETEFFPIATTSSGDFLLKQEDLDFNYSWLKNLRLLTGKSIPVHFSWDKEQNRITDIHLIGQIDRAYEDFAFISHPFFPKHIFVSQEAIHDINFKTLQKGETVSFMVDGKDGRIFISRMKRVIHSFKPSKSP